MFISSSQFRENIAKQGSCLFFELFPSYFENCTFYHNNASYGIKNGSYPYRLRLSQSTIDKANGSFLRNMPTGVFLPVSIEIEICDLFYQRISTLEQGFLGIKLLDLNNLTQQKTNYSSVQGNLFAKISHGIATFEQITFFSNPTNITLGLAFFTPLINQNFGKFDYNNIILSENEYIIMNSYFYVLPIQIRDCVPGEIYDFTIHSCSICPVNTFSLNKSDKKCSECYLSADCFGGNNVSLHPGFWRSGISSSIIHSCTPYPDSCL